MLDTPYPVLLEPDEPLDAYRGGRSRGNRSVAEVAVTLLNTVNPAAQGAGAGFHHVQSCFVRVRECAEGAFVESCQWALRARRACHKH